MKSQKTKALILALFLGVVATVAAGVAAFTVQAPDAPAFEAIQSQYRSSELIITDRFDRPLQEVRFNSKVRRLSWVTLAEVPPVLTAMLLQAEDRRFYSHFGVDLFALVKGAWGRVSGEGNRGASTISMQVADLVLGNSKERAGHSSSGRRTFKGKLEQIRRALVLESAWTKPQILEAYLNLVFFRGEMQGLGVAAQGLFQKSPFGLDEAESAILAALIRAPNAAPSAVQLRACWLLKSRHPKEQDGLCGPLENKMQALQAKYSVPVLSTLAPQTVRFFKRDKIGGRVKSTLDAKLQALVYQTLRREVLRLRENNMNNAAGVVLDNKTGDVLAYVGNVDVDESARFVDAASAPRQAGSTLKTFLYARAIDKKQMTAATLLLDTPTDFKGGNELYRPSNFDHRFRNAVSARAALASSLNIPAVSVLEMNGVEDAVELMEQLGFTGLLRPDFYGPSLALGSVDVRLLDLANAYRALANGGVWTPYRFEASDATEQVSRRVISEDAAFIIGDVLSDRGSRGSTFGFSNPLATRFWTAVKTGTSKDMRDNWCVGYSQDFTVAIWAGNLSGEPMWTVSGVQGAAPAWLAIMNELHVDHKSDRPEAPAGVVQAAVKFSEKETAVPEWFIKGTEPNEELVSLIPNVQSRLKYPADQTRIALDPDIPKARQRIYFAVQDSRPGQWLRLNGEVLKLKGESVAWSPKRGRYRLELMDSSGQVLDVASFLVQGK